MKTRREVLATATAVAVAPAQAVAAVPGRTVSRPELLDATIIINGHKLVGEIEEYSWDHEHRCYCDECSAQP